MISPDFHQKKKLLPGRSMTWKAFCAVRRAGGPGQPSTQKSGMLEELLEVAGFHRVHGTPSRCQASRPESKYTDKGNVSTRDAGESVASMNWAEDMLVAAGEI